MMELKYLCIPPALRFLWFLASRAVMLRVYEAHKALVLWRKSSHRRGRDGGLLRLTVECPSNSRV